MAGELEQDATETDDLSLDAVVAAAGDLTREVAPDGSVVIGVPVAGASRVVRVHAHADGSRWTLSDRGATAAQLGPGVVDAVRRLRAAGHDVRAVEDRIEAGPFSPAVAPAAVLRFASSLDTVGTALDVAEQVALDGAAFPGTSVPELSWTDDTEWDVEHVAASAREFQEEALRRWAG